MATTTTENSHPQRFSRGGSNSNSSNYNMSPAPLPKSKKTSKEDEDSAAKLQEELNRATVQHREELYWLKLELNTIRQEKEGVEDQLSELHRDMQEMEEAEVYIGHSTAIDDADYVSDLQSQLQKYEKMIRIMNNQIALVSNSSDNVIKSLKEEISDLMDDKSRTEMNLMNRLSDVDKERRELLVRLQVLAEQQEQQEPLPLPRSPRAAVPAPTAKNGTNVSPEEVTIMQAEILRLTTDNQKLRTQLATERTSARTNVEQLSEEGNDLSRQVKQLQNDLLVAQSSASSTASTHTLEKLHQDRNETVRALERVALVWDRADESIRNLESVMMELKPPTTSNQQQLDDNQERLLSTLETASLVHGQVKVSLMLIELKLRNNLACLMNDHDHLGAFDPMDPVVSERLSTIQSEAMAAIDHVESVLNEQVEMLEAKAEDETRIVKQTLESKVEDLRQMQGRQQKLEDEMTKLRKEKQHMTEDGVASKGKAEMFVSRKVLERLQNEVLHIVERVREKNEIIGRLTASVEEHKMREAALMEQLKRLLKGQAQFQPQERPKRTVAKTREMDVDKSKVTESECLDDTSEYSEEELIEEDIIEDEETVEEATVSDE